MPWIRVVSDDEATGDIARQFEAARKRAGKVYNIVRIMSPNPQSLDASMAMYRAIMFGASPLSRAHREMLAVVVSKANLCDY